MIPSFGWAYANGWAPMITAQSNPIWFFAMFLLLPVCAVLPFLLAAPRTAHPMDLQARTFCASP